MEENKKGFVTTLGLLDLEEKLMENMKNIDNLIQNSSDTPRTGDDMF